MFDKITSEIRGIVQQEVAAAKREVSTRAKRDATGIGLIAGAVLLAVLAVVALTFAAIAGLATEMSFWLAALIVAVVYLLIAAALVLAGKKQLQKGGAPLPRDTMASMKDDIREARRNGVAQDPAVPLTPAARSGVPK